jgi:serine/threonine-protein kinase
MPLKLEITEGHSKGTAFTFTEPANFLVGRANPEAHFRLPDSDPYFSRRHFVIEIAPPFYRLIDLKSRNGTFVNGVKVPAIELRDGDVITCGKTTMVVRIEFDSESTMDVPLSDEPGMPPVEGTAVQPFPLAPLSPPGAPTIPGYRLQSELGRGGMGVVYRAVRESDERTVAIKTIKPDIRPSPHAVARFLREARITCELNHPGIVAGLDNGESMGTFWLAMEYIDGRDGYKILQTEGPLKISRAVNWTRQLLEALAYAHDLGRVHRDVKPANILISQTPEGERVRITDFGLARAYQASMMSVRSTGLTQAGKPLGTLKFMPLEQLLDASSVKPPADQYSAAATLYQLLTGKYLFANVTNDIEWHIQVYEGNPTPIRSHRPEIPERLAATIHKALSRKPEDRFKDVREFSAALSSEE